MTAKAVARKQHKGEAGEVQGTHHESGQAESSMEQPTTLIDRDQGEVQHSSPQLPTGNGMGS